MPLRRALQYLHAAWVSEGVNTDWRTASDTEQTEAAALMDRLRYLTTPDHGNRC